MIPDNQTNRLFISDCLPVKHPDFYNRFNSLLSCENINIEYLPFTKDIWAVDFMPIQVSENKFIQFVYNPDYLQSKKWIKTIPDVDKICDSLNLNRIKSDIILDGGNVVKESNKVILCDKVFGENPKYNRKEIRLKLEELFETDGIVLVPQQSKDFTGHADGMIRFMDNDTVIINDNSKEKEDFQRALKIAIENAGLNYIEIPYNPYGNRKDSQANGVYINYLQMDKFILLPVFSIKEDEIVVRQFEELFKGFKILTINSNEIADKGGILNCITWNIKNDKNAL